MKRRKHINLKLYVRIVKSTREKILFDYFLAELQKENPKFLELIKF